MVFALSRASEVVGIALQGEPEPAMLETLLGGCRFRMYDRWSQFETAAIRADCAVVILRWLGDALVATRVHTLRRRAPDTPLVVVMNKQWQNAQLALQIGIEAIVGSDELRAELARAVKEAGERTFLRLVARNAELAAQLDPVARLAIAAACRSTRSIHSVAELAAVTEATSSKLRRAWRHTSPPGLGLKTFLDWPAPISDYRSCCSVPPRSFPRGGSHPTQHQSTKALLAAE